MNSFKLQIVTPDGMFFDGEAERITVPTIDGPVAILARHIDYISALGMGEARVLVNGEIKRAACIGGMVTVSGGEVKVIATTFEWSENIDLERAERAYALAEEKIKSGNLPKHEMNLAEARLKRAIVRMSVAKK